MSAGASRFSSITARLKRDHGERNELDFEPPPTILILTPLKNAVEDIDDYVRRVQSLTYPHKLISLGFLESDSKDGTFDRITSHQKPLRGEFQSVDIWQRHFGYKIPPGRHRGDWQIQIPRRTVLAKSRNHLLFHALREQDWVLWLDVDVIEYPSDLIERLLAAGRDIVQPHCVLDYGGHKFDAHDWLDQRLFHLDDLRDQGEFVKLNAVGGTVLFIRADIHRDGLIFPSFMYGLGNDRAREGRGELETEGLGIMARDMGHIPWGMPHFEVIHRRH